MAINKTLAVALLCNLLHSGCTSSSPIATGQDIILGNTVKLNCYIHNPKWVVTDTQDGNESYYIYPADYIISPVLQTRGFVSIFQFTTEGSVSSLSIPGTVENNQTVISCQEIGTTSGDLYILNVIGPPERPGDVRGWVEEFSPVRLRLEWQESFSHHDHPVLYYTLYTRDGVSVNTTDTNISLSLGHHDVELSNNCSQYDINITAVNNVGESDPSPVVSMQRTAAHKQFAIDGSLFSQRGSIVLQLHIKFPELCEGQEMRYRVELVEERTGRLVYQDSRVLEYRGRDVDYSNTTSHLLDDGYYTAVVFLRTGDQNTSSSPHNLSLITEDSRGETKTDGISDSGGQSTSSFPLNISEDKKNKTDGISDSGGQSTFSFTLNISEDSAGENKTDGINPGKNKNKSNTGLLLAVIAALAAAFLCLLVIVIVIGAVIVKHKFTTHAVSEEPKENRNPIYEGPLYENMEESPPSLPPPPSTRRRVSGGLTHRSVDNVYHRSPVPIPTGSETEGLYAELADRKQDSQPTAAGGEEEPYTIMSPVGPTPTDERTSYLEERAVSIINSRK